MNEFKVELTKIGNICVVRTNGYLDDEGGKVFRQKCVDQLDKGNINFVFNLGGTPVINSTGLSMLLDIMVQIIDYNEGNVAVCGLTKLTQTALQMTGVLTLCDSYQSEEEAIEAVKEASC